MKLLLNSVVWKLPNLSGLQFPPLYTRHSDITDLKGHEDENEFPTWEVLITVPGTSGLF